MSKTPKATDNMGKTAFHDGRTIKAIWWDDGEEYCAVGGQAPGPRGSPIITRIVPFAVQGQGAWVPWVEVFAGTPEFLYARLNLSHVGQVQYEPPAGEGVT